MTTKEKTWVDPVCGMSVNPDNSPHKTTHNSESYFFCAAGCKAAFEKDPDTFLQESAQTSSHMPSSSGLVSLSVSEPAALEAPAGEKRLDVPVLGMHCASCVTAIEGSLAGVEGVFRASANFATERVSLDYDPARVSFEQIEDAVASAGPYKLITRTTEAASDTTVEDVRAAEYAILKKKTIVSALLSVVIMTLSMVSAEAIGATQNLRTVLLFIVTTPVFLMVRCAVSSRLRSGGCARSRSTWIVSSRSAPVLPTFTAWSRRSPLEYSPLGASRQRSTTTRSR